MNDIYDKLIESVRNDLVPSLGVTEPGAIAFAAASAARAVGGKVSRVTVKLNSGICKNSFTCAVPGTDGMGCALAAALGSVAGDPSKKLLSTEGADEADIAEAKRLVSEGSARAELLDISPEVFIEAVVETDKGSASAVVSGRHDSLTGLSVNGASLPVGVIGDAEKEAFSVSSVTFADIIECVESAEDLGFVDEAVGMDLKLFREGRERGLIPLTEARCGTNEEDISSPADRADLVTSGAIEARVRGANAPAMAITGSGSHGILCTLPVHEAARSCGERVTAEDERRAILLSMLITKYIKECSGLLSAACGCVLAGGTGAALGITYLKAKAAPCADPLEAMLTNALNSMAASVTGMICHGGNTGCSLKASVGVRMAYAAAEMAAKGLGAESVHGILGLSPEETMKNMGRIARDMLSVEKTILGIMSCKGSYLLI
ncbi:MAG: serine dehydratase subunit alpha family protein [Clostridia bacterium]|nr:serine dehydratase subunit alpha family protein [Clostridia bacterium]